MQSAAPLGVVLVADGEKTVRILARVALESSGWRVIEAASADDAIRVALERRPRFAVLDAGIDGFDVAAALAAEPATQDTAVVFVAVSSDAKRRADTLDAPFLQKPFNPVALVNAVEQAAQR
jgi:two-component system, OmpR family, KDP operon response regulator KdpE